LSLLTCKLLLVRFTRRACGPQTRCCTAHRLQCITNINLNSLLELLSLSSDTLGFHEGSPEIRLGSAVTEWQTDLHSDFRGAITVCQQVLQRLAIATKQIRRELLRRNNR